MFNNKLFKNDRYKEKLLLSYKRQLSIVVGERRVGKTFLISCCRVEEAIKEKQITFLWLRISKTEIDDAKGEFFSDIEKFKIFPNYSFRVVGKYGYAKNLTTKEEFPICYFDFIKNSQNIKSIPFPYVKYVVLDEFMEEKTNNKYKKTYQSLMSIAYSVFEFRPVRCILIGNAVSIINPIFEKLGVKDISRAFTKGKTYVIENTNYEPQYDKFREQAKDSSFGQLVKGSDYEKYSLNNDFLLDDYEGVDEKVKVSLDDLLVAIKLESGVIGVYYNEKRITFKTIKERSVKDEYVITPYTNFAKNDIIYMKYNERIYKRIFSLTTKHKVIYSSLQIKNEICNLRDKVLGSFTS